MGPAKKAVFLKILLATIVAGISQASIQFSNEVRINKFILISEQGLNNLGQNALNSIENAIYKGIKLEQTSTDPACQATYTPSETSYKFWDFYAGAPFNKSVYTPFSTNIRTGLKLTSFFEYSDQCITNVQNALSQIWFIYKNGSCNVPEYDIRKMIYYTS